MFESKYNKLLTIVLVIVIIAIIGLLVFWGIEVFQKNSITNETAEFVDSTKEMTKLQMTKHKIVIMMEVIH